MSVKILLADDSPTVHKVIKIILKDEPYEIIECSHEDQLMGMLSSSQFNMVFLDFNFSEKSSGYDLARNIKKSSPQSKILVMYGTFDTVDESLLNNAEVEQFVVKPFDTAKFKTQVQSLASGGTQSFSTESLVGDAWTIKEDKKFQAPSMEAKSIEENLGDWGMAIPGVIGESFGAAELPPVIDAPVDSLPPVVQKEEIKHTAHDSALPNESDLEYPDMSDLSLELDSSPKPSSKLVSLDDLSLGDSNDMDTLLELSQMDDDENVQKIEEQIRDEVEADLWSVDSLEESTPRLSVVKETPEEDLSFSGFQTTKLETMDGGESFDENLFSRIDENEEPAPYTPKPEHQSRPTPTPPAPMTRSSAPAFDLEDLRPLIKEMINQAVADYCRQHIDKVAWEVIPDLAENLIKSELKKISDKVSRDL